MTLQIDKEFRGIIPSLSQEEYDGLEKNLLENGYQEDRGKILTWNGVIIDGHNRYEICKKHDVPYVSSEISFKDRVDAKIFIRQNQLDRRNLSVFARTELALGLKKDFQEKAKINMSLGAIKGNTSRGKPVEKDSADNEENTANSGVGKGGSGWERFPNPNNERIETREEVGKVANVSGRTVSKVEKIIDSKIKHIADKARSGEIKVNTAYKEVQKELSEIKRCTSCGEEKVFADFRYRRDTGRHSPWCKKCEADYDKKRDRSQRSGRKSGSSITKILDNIKAKPETKGMHTFIVGGINTLSNAIKQVEDDLKKHLNSIEKPEERGDIKQKLESQASKIQELINYLEERV